MPLQKPFLFLDVDGVLNPARRDLPGYTLHTLNPYEAGPPFTLALNSGHGPLLTHVAAAAGCELAWATTWEDHANRLIAPIVGLPTLPYVPIPSLTRWGRNSVLTTGSWKARHVLEFADGRPFVWLEDEPDAGQQVENWSRTIVTGRHLVIRVRPERGLGQEHIDKAVDWLATNSPGGVAAGLHDALTRLGV